MHMLTVASFISNTKPRTLNLQKRELITLISKVLLDAWFMDHMEFHRLRCHLFRNISIMVQAILNKSHHFHKLPQNKRNKIQLSTVKFQFQCNTKWLLEVWISQQIWLKKVKRSMWLKILMNSKKMFSNVQELWSRLTPKRICTRMITFHIIQPEIKIEKDRSWILKCS